MLFAQVQQIQMAMIGCNLVGHQGKFIDTLCLNPECEESSTLCSKCMIKGHPNCRDQILELEFIPQQLIELRQLQFAVVVLKDKINIQFKELLSRIEQFLQPVSNYQDSPNSTNLDGIGQLLRQLPKQSIEQLIEEKIQEIKDFFDNQNSQDEKVLEELQLSADDWFRKGRKAIHQCYNYDEAIKCYEKAIKLDPNISDYWHCKGKALYCLKRCEEALLFYEKAIRIDPNNIDYWISKGDALKETEQYEEAIKCYEKVFQFVPHHHMAEASIYKAQAQLKEQQQQRR